jgi:hypothetical protein
MTVGWLVNLIEEEITASLSPRPPRLLIGTEAADDGRRLVRSNTFGTPLTIAGPLYGLSRVRAQPLILSTEW